MKLLFVTPVFPGQAFGRRPFNFLRVFAPRHDVDLICASAKPVSPDEIHSIKDMGVRSVTVVPHPVWKGALAASGALLSRSPLRVAYCQSQQMSRAVCDFLARNPVDLIHIDRSRMARLAALRPANVKCVVDFTDAMTLLFDRKLQYTRNPLSRVITFWERRTQPLFETQIAPTFDACLLCSPIDAAIVRTTVASEKVHVIPNMVDTDEFVPKTREGSPRLIFTGTLSYFPNMDSLLWFVREILPLVRREITGVETLVIGAKPGREVLGLHGNQGIHVVGAVERMSDHLYADDIFVCPLRVGAGVRNKILEAMSAGMAVVSTTLGAEGIPIQDGLDIALADDPISFAEKTIALLRDQKAKRRLGEQARETVIEHHSAFVIGRQIERLYEQIIAGESLSAV